ncbi:MAG: FliA/WhiG family RNA polymerase sigma factor [Deltaproteobacteria bacterium]|jgi:RNA polymerase sigma factor for flagellar operon FliA|nr:FliA/WhiG family RNA polymerase sigma factor [Deltaproteobacteria bacterium]
MSQQQTYGPNLTQDKPAWRRLSMTEKTEYVEKYSSLIRYIADRLVSRLPGHIVKDDLISAGVIGLIDAVDRFESNRGIMFKTYAEFRIKGAMIDELRNLDWVPRTIRKKSSEIERLNRTLEQELGHPPTDEEMANALGLEMPAFLKLLDEISSINILDINAFKVDGITNKEPADLYEILADDTNIDPLDAMGLEEAKQVLAEAIDALPEKERLVVSLYYHEDLTMKEIGQVMGYTESRISQLHTKSVVRIRSKVSNYFENKSPK